MYTLYYLPGTCSLAVHTMLIELNQDFRIIERSEVEDYSAINPVGMVPVLVDNDFVVREGAAIMLYLMEKHLSPKLPPVGETRSQAIQDLMFANATMHPAYGRLFFIEGTITDTAVKKVALAAATKTINTLWAVVECKLQDQHFLGGSEPGVADILLKVYSRWGGAFDVDIQFGPKTQAMLDAVEQLPSFQRALQTEAQKQAA